jgi:hypothetical protein
MPVWMPLYISRKLELQHLRMVPNPNSHISWEISQCYIHPLVFPTMALSDEQAGLDALPIPYGSQDPIQRGTSRIKLNIRWALIESRRHSNASVRHNS